MKTPNIKRLLASAVLTLPFGLLGADTDGDGLDDSVETGTGIYLSVTNTGTSPLLADSDDDGAGDWYEVATIEANPSGPQPNAPNSASIKPNIPYPLPAPSSAPPATNKPVKVFILSGQSNMVGQGNVDPLGTNGTLSTIVKLQGKFPNLLSNGTWRVRNDVSYRGVIAAVGNTNLMVGQGGSTTSIGPELGFGHVMGYYFDEPVLIIKSSQGGRALGWDFLPPGSVQYAVGSTTYAGYGDSPASWTTGTTPVPTPGFYGGYQYDQCFLSKTNWAPAGATNAAVFNVTDVLDNFAAQYPKYASQGFEIAGFAWFQGWNDGLSYTAAYANRYETNLVQFIKQIRAYYESRYPGKIKAKAPFVIATCAFDGWSTTYPTRVAVANAQLAVSNPVKYPEFAGNVKTMEARNFWRDVSVSPANQNYHYHRNAETFMLVGDALGRGMIDLLNSATPDTNAPVISSFIPADNATNVAVSANLVLTFNESIALGTGNITLKNLTDATQTVIAITDATQVSAAGSVLTINPTVDLLAAKSYAIQIAATAIKDLATNSFAGITNDTTWNFITAAPDLTPPMPNPMTWTMPPAAISSAAITMTATTASDPSGVEYFFDCTSAGGHDSGWQNSPTYTDAGLAPSTSYSYQVKARDKSANTNETDWSSVQSATTSPPDTNAPVVSSFSPADNATNVAVSANLLVTFNESITFGTGNITLTNLTDSTQTVIAITNAAQVSVAGPVLTINPTADLIAGKTYAIQIAATAIKDLANNSFAGIADDTTWNFATAAPPPSGEILIVNQVEGFLGSTKTQVTTTHNGTTQVSYDATGVDKLVVAIGTESGFNNNSATVTGVNFNGDALTQAVQENTIFDTTPPLPGDWDGGTAAIYYLDNPFQGAATFTVSATTSGGSLNGGWVSIIGLASTLDGVGNTGASWTTQTSAGNVATSISTSVNGSLVIAMVENSGRQNGAGTPTAVAPLTLSNNGNWGSQWGSGASGYQIVPASGTTITPTFSTSAGGNIHVIAAEFLPLPQDNTAPTLTGIADDNGGAPITINTMVTYTVTFSEDMDASTVSAADFGNAATSTVTIGTITETSPGVFTVPVTATGAGSLQLKIIAGAILKDVAGNSLGTTSDIADDTTITVNSDYTTWAAHYPAANLTDPNADYDGDGQSNDHERIWGLNPTNAASKNPFTFTSSLGTGTFSYTRRVPALTGLSYTVWTSTNLVNWTQDAGAVQTPGASVAEVETVAVTLSPALLSNQRLFIRMKAQ